MARNGDICLKFSKTVPWELFLSFTPKHVSFINLSHPPLRTAHLPIRDLAEIYENTGTYYKSALESGQYQHLDYSLIQVYHLI